MSESQKTKVLFVCIGNACRSPMAEALARHLAADVIEASSAGIAPLGFISPQSIEVLNEKGISMDGQGSKQLTDEMQGAADLIINMTRLARGANFRRRGVEDWPVKDPFGEVLEAYREVRDEIERRVIVLAERLRQEQAERGTATGRPTD